MARWEWEPCCANEDMSDHWRVPLRFAVPSCTVVDNPVDAARIRVATGLTAEVSWFGVVGGLA